MKGMPFWMLGILLLTSLPLAPRPVKPLSSVWIGGCPQLPADSIWNTPVNTLPVHAQSAQWVNAIGLNDYLHADFGSGEWDGGPIGIPFNIASAATPRYPVDFTWGDQSDAGPYPIPDNPLIEYGSDHHLLVVAQNECKLYELYNVTPPQNGSGWQADAGAIFDLNANTLRPETWTSADAAGLPILPGLARYDEVAAGQINHALRVTVSNSRAEYLWPARHYAPYHTGTDSPPMGVRLRLKSSFNIAPFGPQARVILMALKTYGMIIADNGSDWFISGAPDQRWDDDDLHRLQEVLGNNFEAVDVSGLMVHPDSARSAGLDLPKRLWLPFTRK